jgi:hypothetical protein
MWSRLEGEGAFAKYRDLNPLTTGVVGHVEGQLRNPDRG